MSAMDIDKPLDEMIAAKPRSGRRGGGRGARGGARGGAQGASAGGNARARYSGSAPRNVSQTARAAAAPAGVKPITADATKIIISNLPGDVNEAAVRDLMQSTVGPVRTVHMSYTSTGKSTGTATVIFRNKGDANKAHSSYHNRMIDNQRPMKVEIAIDPNAVSASLSARVAPAPKEGRKPAAGAPRRQPRPRAPRPAKKTADELDAEMAAYSSAPAA